MKNKLKFLTKQSLDKKIKTKWFKGVNILLLVLFILITNIDRIISFFGGDFKDEITISVKDEVNIYDSFVPTFEEISNMVGESKNFKLEKTDKEIDELKEEIKEKDDQIIVHIIKDEKNYLRAEIISYDEIGTVTTQLISSSISSVKSSVAAMASGLTNEQILALTSPAEVTTILTNPDVENQEGKDIISAGVMIVFILPCFFLIIMLVQMIGAEVNDEKSTRSMEIIISNVPPKIHFLSKILASTAFVVIQGFLILLYGVIALLVRNLIGGVGLGVVSGEVSSSLNDILQMVKETGIFSLLLKGLPVILILFVLSFIAYAIVAGVLASMTTSIEDFQQLQTPIILIIMVGYYLAIMAVQFDGSIFIEIASFIPMLSFLLSPVLYMIGQITIIEMIISTGIMAIFTWVIFHYGLRIYKVGILNYSSSKLWRKMFKSLKQK